jgi:hypothetical protein
MMSVRTYEVGTTLAPFSAQQYQLSMRGQEVCVVLRYKCVSKSFRTGRLERELRMVQLSATRCSCIAILWVSLVSFVAITLCVASQVVIPKVSIYFVIDSVRKLWDTPSKSTYVGKQKIITWWRHQMLWWDNYWRITVIGCVNLIYWHFINTWGAGCWREYEGVSKSFRTESITKYTLTTINTRWEPTQRVMAAVLTILTHKIAI